MPSREQLEQQLNDFDAGLRREALEQLAESASRGDIAFPEPRRAVNLHAHTFFSYNGYGYSPSCYAWKARCEGLLVAGIVDFDVLDGVEEFLDACTLLGLRACAGMETRVYVPEFGKEGINSPGEPGIAYHMGVGFVSSGVPDTAMLRGLKETAQKRNLSVLARVNPYLAPADIAYERDVLPLTPKANPTERHLCTAYRARSAEVFPDAAERAAFWAGKLGIDAAKAQAMFDEAPAFEGLIRSKCMKSGGVGYVQPEGPDFPSFAGVNAFVASAGAVPTYAWLDGTTEAEHDVDRLFGVLLENGVHAINIIPDRNWRLKDPEQKKVKVAKLHEIVERCEKQGFPIVSGTEMNAHGQLFVDQFDAPEMEPVTDACIRGAMVFYGHTVLQRAHGIGYLSDWAMKNFNDVHAKNAFYQRIGETADPARDDAASTVNSNMSPDQVLASIAR